MSKTYNMKDQFDIKKFLTENRLTRNSRRREEEEFRDDDLFTQQDSDRIEYGIDEEEGAEKTFYFGYDLDNIEDVQNYLEDNYEEEDYKLHIGYGDDIMNGATIKNPVVLKDETFQDLVQGCDGAGHYREEEEIDEQEIGTAEFEPVLKHLESAAQEALKLF